MDGLREYAISIVAAALICSILSGVVPKGTAKELVRLLCGLFLAITVLRPLGRVDCNVLEEYPFDFAQDAEAAAAVGEKMAEDAMQEIIKAETEAYILDKATALNAELSVEITVSEDRIPVCAELCGELSPYARTRLEAILETDLGITKENQVWSG